MTGVSGRFVVARHWERWCVQDLACNPPRVLRRFTTEVEAAAFAERLNRAQSSSGGLQVSLFDGDR